MYSLSNSMIVNDLEWVWRSFLLFVSYSQLVISEHTTKPSAAREIVPRNSVHKWCTTSNQTRTYRSRGSTWMTNKTAGLEMTDNWCENIWSENDEVKSDGWYIRSQSSKLRVFIDILWQSWHRGKKSNVWVYMLMQLQYCSILLLFYSLNIYFGFKF